MYGEIEIAQPDLLPVAVASSEPGRGDVVGPWDLVPDYLGCTSGHAIGYVTRLPDGPEAGLLQVTGGVRQGDSAADVRCAVAGVRRDLRHERPRD